MRAARPHPNSGGGAPRSSVPALRRGRAGAAQPLAWGALGAAATALVAAVDPHVGGRYPACPLLALTGLACPLCGALRATHDLAHLDVAGAWAANPLWVLVVPVLVLAWATWTVRAWRWGRADAGRARTAQRVPLRLLLVLVGGAAVVFGVLRNVPALAAALGPGG
ncbi:hypothetical protein GCM10009809_32430 [Isoptericola hypogeus]|uniref:DUF2752 domain-containing protein n=1 Tax=Isoptericola hypogeus TaxID=300179 RepID=A0ABN2JRN6_9MICO